MSYPPGSWQSSTDDNEPLTIPGVTAVLIILALIALGLWKAAELLLPWLLALTR